MAENPAPMSVDIDDGVQDRIAAHVRSLMEDARIAATDTRLAQIEHEAASIIVQAILQETQDPAAVFEGMLVQLGIQLAYRAGKNPLAWADRAKEWIDDGLTYGLSSGIGQPARGAA